MDRQQFDQLANQARSLAAKNCRYVTGYIRGLRILFHGQYGTERDHQNYLHKGGDTTRGYHDGLNGRQPNP